MATVGGQIIEQSPQALTTVRGALRRGGAGRWGMGNGRDRDGMGRQQGWGEQEYLLNTIIAMDFILGQNA